MYYYITKKPEEGILLPALFWGHSGLYPSSQEQFLQQSVFLRD